MNKIKITDIKTFPVNVGSGSQLVVKVETDQGIYGWGASGLSGRELAVMGAIDHFRLNLIGKDTSRIGTIWQDLYRGQYFEGGRVLTAAISAIDFIEEPIRDETPEAYESLRKMINVPFALGEEFASKWQFLPYLERGIAQFARVDVCNVGGITEAKKVAAMAEAHYIDLMPHNPLGPICTAASIHLAAACPNVSWLEEVNTPAEQADTNDRNVYPVQPQLEGARYLIPDAPGLGVEFNEELARSQEFRPVEIPRLKRSDGSYTNW